MSDNQRRGALYLDIAAVWVGALFVAGQLHAHLVPGGPALLADVFGWWVTLAGALLWIRFRRVGCSRTSSWPLALGTVVVLSALATLYWRWGVTPLVAAMVSSSLLCVGGLSLRTKRMSDRLLPLDRFALAAAIGAVLLTLVAAEGVLRVVPGMFGPEVRQIMLADERNYGVADAYVGYLHHPNATIELTGRDFHALHHVDALGFRNASPWPERADVVAVGDSVTFGYGVADDEAWPAIVSKALLPARLMNLGLMGAGPQQYLRLYETFGVQFQPRLLLVGFFGRNDFWDAGAFASWLNSGVAEDYILWRDFGRPEYAGFTWSAPFASASDRSRVTLYRAAKRSHLYTLLTALHRRATGSTPPVIYPFADGNWLQLFPGDLAAQQALASTDRLEFASALKALQDLRAEAAAHGTTVLVVLLPSKEEVYLPLLGGVVPDLTGAFRAALDRSAIESLDLLPSFRDQARSGARLFFQVDGHPNLSGQSLVAEDILGYLKANAARYGLTSRAFALDNPAPPVRIDRSGAAVPLPH